MQDLYSAVMILGRSIEDIDRHGWTCGELGEAEGPKCVNGVLAMAAGSQCPQYIWDMTEDFPEVQKALMIASTALLDSIPEAVLGEYPWIHDSSALFRYHTGQELVSAVGNTLVTINDAESESPEDLDEEGCPLELPILNRQGARDWFEAAFDKLAAELPEPRTVKITPADFSEAEKRIREEARRERQRMLSAAIADVVEEERTRKMVRV